jgi:hypothetical protein
MTDPLKIIGANGARKENDFYPTPPECTVALLNFLEERFLIRRGDTIWEPACGSNAMVNVMQQKGYSVIGTDIVHGQDYLTTDLQNDYEWIITNPPFCAAQEFITSSAARNKPFALLLKSQYWHSAKRRKIFAEYQPTFVLPLTWRPDFTGKGSSMLDMIWCVWVGPSHVTYFLPLKKPRLLSKEVSSSG